MSDDEIDISASRGAGVGHISSGPDNDGDSSGSELGFESGIGDPPSARGEPSKKASVAAVTASTAVADDDSSDDELDMGGLRAQQGAESSGSEDTGGVKTAAKGGDGSSSDDDSDDDGPGQSRAGVSLPSAPPRGVAGVTRKVEEMEEEILESSSSSSSSKSEDDEAARAAAQAKALAKLEREEQMAAEMEAAKRTANLKVAAAKEQLRRSQDEARDDEMIPEDQVEVAPADRSASGSSPAVRPGSSGPSELQLAMRDKRAKEKLKSYSTRFNSGYADTRGRRPTMEDKIVIHGQLGNRANDDLYAVFDGHGGDDASTYAAKQLPRILNELISSAPTATGAPNPNDDVGSQLIQAFEQCEQELENDSIKGGTTAIAVRIVNQSIWIANLGDCRAVLAVSQSEGGARRLSFDHKPHNPEEERRIVAAGGHVTKTMIKGVMMSRVVGLLGVSRSLGDVGLRKYLSCTPEIHGPFTVPEKGPASLIIGCDGVWDVLTDASAARLALTADSPEHAATRIRDLAYHKGSTDNISVLVIELKKG